MGNFSNSLLTHRRPAYVAKNKIPAAAAAAAAISSGVQNNV
jgi:hypothetical protein